MQNFQGILLMIAAMAGFALGDVGIKLLTQTVPLSQIIVTFGGVGTALLALATLRSGQPLLPAALANRAVASRYCAEITATLFMSNALALVPLSLLTAILQAGPLMVALGAVVFFGESVSWRRWCAICIGLIGVLVILRPGGEGFDLAALLPVGAMLALAARDLSTRAAPGTLTNLQLATLGFSAFIVAGCLQLPFYGRWIMPDLREIGFFALAIVPSIMAYYAITAAMRVGEISVVTPFRYARLIFGLTLGAVLFGERIDGWMLVGGALVVGSGIYTVLRERAARRAALAGLEPARRAL
ncbi:DMT family transporter [Marivita sp. GX14005]|uniref:DMT family transporter n=1 Tax=Marivita sp. GX14005 TaxID=2942276 RepID=UPI0020195B8A|nr:DMT family transporter [Marivita sp. GX14005]MCL3883428.1 DMT family transporter [Marivita sp. GX14005]